MRCHLYLLLFWCLIPTGIRADTAFDLTGPKVDVRVRRGEVTLPIGETPYLLPGDRLWIHPDLPESQSAPYELIVTFLRGATNPPPPEWFTRVETWNREAREEGVFVIVPPEAQQALIFLAPETSGGFSTLRAAVRGRPGVFVRAVQDLQAASWERMRLDAYLAEVRVTSQTDPTQLKERAERAARSLGIKLDQQCFYKPLEQQAPCLAQHTEGLLLDDANVQSRVEQLANGSTGNLMTQLSSSPMGGAGVYSAYIGAVVDTAKILASLHTAHFQYIPALALPSADTMDLRLNVPPSFRDPKSVVVVALPPVGDSKAPPLHPVNPTESYCAQRPGLALPAEGAPAVFATQLAHDLKLRISQTPVDAKNASAPVEAAIEADASQGGLVLAQPVPPLPAGELTAVVHGKWGFDDWEGPHYHLRSAVGGKWAVTAADQSALVVGREDTLHIDGENSVCVERVAAKMGSDSPLKLAWKSPKPGTIETVVPLKNAAPGPVNIEIFQFGMEKPDELPLMAYAEAASIDGLSLNAGDTKALLKGKRLDEVAKVSLGGITLSPATLTRVQDSDQLTLTAGSSTAGLEAGTQSSASVQLQDGRLVKIPVTIQPRRPQVALLSRGAQDQTSDAASPVHLGSADDLPVDRRLVFFLRSSVPESFARDEKVEVAAADGSFHATLGLADGSLVLEDAKTAMGAIEPLDRFGFSAFGPLKVRALAPDGVAGDWIPLGTLVRLPGFRELHCPRAPAKPCTLTATNLFLATSIAATPEFDNPTDVPGEFTGTQMTVPHPANGVLYLKLRDDPETVQTLTLPVLPMSPAAASAVQSQAATAAAKTE